jgi:glutamate-1-semialdehyde 2,1-aminomutase
MLVNSGTEAVMSAIRVSRGYTQKKYVIKFNGCYHGHSDNLLVKAGSGLATQTIPTSSGITIETIAHTITLEYNDIQSITDTFAKFGDDIACVIVEPFAGNMNLIRPSFDFMNTLRDLCSKFQSVLIFDEVMTGFRVSLNCAQGILGIKPDLTILGKIVGGGMPLALFGGKKEIMNQLSPIGSVYQAGTLSGNPIAITAGLATITLIQNSNFYEQLSYTSNKLTNGLIQLAKRHSIPFSADYIGGIFGYYFNENIPSNFIEAGKGNQAQFKDFYEAGFLSSTHSDSVIEKTLEFANKAFANIVNIE